MSEMRHTQPIPDDADLPSLKAEIRELYGHVPGVEAFGIGERRLRIYVRTSEVKRDLPCAHRGVPVDVIVVEEIVLA